MALALGGLWSASWPALICHRHSAVGVVTVHVHDDVGHVGLRLADVVFEAANEVVSRGQLGVWPRGDDGEEHDEPAVGLQQAELTRRVTSAVDHQLVDGPSLALARRVGLVARHQGPLRRLEVRMHVIDSGLRAERRLHAPRRPREPRRAVHRAAA